MGGGIANNIDFKSRAQTNFTFPFMLTYNSTQAEANAIFSDLASKCGLTGGAKSNLNINYKITVSVSNVLVNETWWSSNTFILVGYPYPHGSHISYDIEYVQFPLSNHRCRNQGALTFSVRDCISHQKKKLFYIL